MRPLRTSRVLNNCWIT